MRVRTADDSGQAIVLLALMLVILLGFAALAIDGGNIYLEQRRAQAAADNAVLAAAYERMRGATDAAGLQAAALASAAGNGYPNNAANNWVVFRNPPQAGAYQGNASYVEVVITQTLPTAFAHFLYRGPVQVTVHSVARGFQQGTPQGNYALITLDDCTKTGNPNVAITGGGNSGGVETFQGGIWLNTTETGGNVCGLEPGNSAGAIGIRVESPWPITSVGSYDYTSYSKKDKITPVPVQTGGNGGQPLPDPLAYLPEPVCTGNGSGAGTAASPYQPGNYNGAGQPSLGGGLLAPGIFCLNGTLHLSGQDRLQGAGVLLVMRSGQLRFTGQAELSITAPTRDFCQGAPGSASASCTYAGIAFWGARNQCGEVLSVGGNGYQHFVGTVYAPCAAFNAHGGGTTPLEAAVWGQVIVGRVLGNGNGSFRIYYDQEMAFQLPPYVQLVE